MPSLWIPANRHEFDHRMTLLARWLCLLSYLLSVVVIAGSGIVQASFENYPRTVTFQTRANSGLAARRTGFCHPCSVDSSQGLPETVGLDGGEETRPARTSEAFTYLSQVQYRPRADRTRGTLYSVSAYSWGCLMPRTGPEPTHRTKAANGRFPVPGVSVAADWAIHGEGSEVLIEGVGFRTVHDKGGAITGRKLDIFVKTCDEARAFGRQMLMVWKVPEPTSRMGR